MRRRMTSLAAASLAVASFAVSGSALADGKAVAATALWLIDNIAPQNNTWDLPCSINWDVPSAKTKAACFFTLSLMRAMNYEKQDIYAMWDSNSPSSEIYFDVLSRSPALYDNPPRFETYFRRVTRAVDIDAGDILVIGPTFSGTTQTYAGHTVIITGPATEILPQVAPRYADTKQYAIPIADSTNSSHGCSTTAYADSRWSGSCKDANGDGKADGTFRSGVGTGYMRVYADAFSNALLGYTWSVTSSQTSYMSPKTRPYHIGRLFKLPVPIGNDLPPPPP